MSLALAITRSSRPAWMAKACSTPGKPQAIDFQLFHPLDVPLQRLAAGAGPRGAAGVGRGDEHRVGVVDADVVVMARAPRGRLPALRRSA